MTREINYSEFVNRLEKIAELHIRVRDRDEKEGNTDDFNWERGYVCSLNRIFSELDNFIQSLEDFRPKEVAEDLVNGLSYDLNTIEELEETIGITPRMNDMDLTKDELRKVWNFYKELKPEPFY